LQAVFKRKELMEKCREYKRIYVTNRHLADGSFCLHIENLLKGNSRPDMVILREKDMEEEEYKALAKNVMKICHDNGTVCILHLFKDVAAELHADGIHLPYPVFSGMDGEERKKFKKTGVSIHSEEEAFNAQKLGASYVIAGHIFKTQCKEGLEPRGTRFLKGVCQKVDIPVYAIGGIDEKNAGLCIEAGAAGVCMMSGFACKK